MTDVSDYQTDVLFLLVGENPVPNYVAAQLLLRQGGAVYLVHSRGTTGTGEIAKRVRQQLAACTTCLVEVDEHSAPDLQATVTAALREHLRQFPSHSVGLNYTGGTKFMAVHAYQAIEEGCKKGCAPVLSYLHADTLELTVEDLPGFAGLRMGVAQDVRPTFQQLFDLHGIKFSGTRRTEPRHVLLAQALADMCSSKDGFEAWKMYRCILFRSGGRRWNEVRTEMQQAWGKGQVIEALESTLGLQAEQPLNLSAAAGRAGFRITEILKNWLNGPWLEEWTLACIEACAAETGIHECYQDLKGRIPGKERETRTREFQIDVAALRGYRLFAISCKAVMDLGEAKLGLMEVFARSRQMGGEEARAALVTTHPDAAKLRQDFSTDWGADHRVQVFGGGHLPNLATHLANWFNNP